MAKQEELPVVNLEDVMASSEPLKTVDITVKGRQPFSISYRTMSWLDKSACVAKATELFMNDAGEPQSMFHVDVYFREALKMMLVDFPWPKSDKILNQLTAEVGLQLQDIIPAPLGDSPQGDNANLADESPKPSKGRKKTRSSSATQ